MNIRIIVAAAFSAAALTACSDRETGPVAAPAADVGSGGRPRRTASNQPETLSSCSRFPVVVHLRACGPYRQLRGIGSVARSQDPPRPRGGFAEGS